MLGNGKFTLTCVTRSRRNMTPLSSRAHRRKALSSLGHTGITSRMTVHLEAQDSILNCNYSIWKFIGLLRAHLPRSYGYVDIITEHGKCQRLPPLPSDWETTPQYDLRTALSKFHCWPGSSSQLLGAAAPSCGQNSFERLLFAEEFKT